MTRVRVNGSLDPTRLDSVDGVLISLSSKNASKMNKKDRKIDNEGPENVPDSVEEPRTCMLPVNKDKCKGAATNEVVRLEPEDVEGGPAFTTRSPEAAPTPSVPGAFREGGDDIETTFEENEDESTEPPIQDISDKHLVSACLVKDPIMVSAEPSTDCKRSRVVMGSLAILVIVGLIMGLVFGLSGRRDDSDDGGDDPSTPRPVLQFCDESDCWRQLVMDLESSQPGNGFGSFVSLAANGSRIAVSAPRDSTHQGQSGMIQVFDIAENGSTTQVGGDIFGESRNDQIVGVLSENGNRLAVSSPTSNNRTGKVKVLELQSNEWVMVGEQFYGTQQGEEFGTSVSLSSDGNVLAIGAWYHHGEAGEGTGAMYVYQYNGQDWDRKGNVLEGKLDERFGLNVAVSDNGESVACATYFSDSLGDATGSVRVYDYNTLSDDWVLKGSRVDGIREYDYFGEFFAMDSTADHFAASAFNSESPRVRTYSFDEDIAGDWAQIGQELKTSDTYDGIIDIALSSDGNFLSVERTFPEQDQFYVFVYYFNGANWQQVGDDIRAQGFGESFRAGMALSSDGRRVAIGGMRPDSTGYTQVFELVSL